LRHDPALERLLRPDDCVESQASSYPPAGYRTTRCPLPI